MCVCGGRAYDNPVSPLEFRCAFFFDSAKFAEWTGRCDETDGCVTRSNGTFCATLVEENTGPTLAERPTFTGEDTYMQELWSRRSSAIGGDFFAAEAGPLDLSAYSAGDTVTFTFTEGGNIGTNPVAAVAYVPEGVDAGMTESITYTMIFTEYGFCYGGFPLWNGEYPDMFLVYDSSIGIDATEVCFTKIA